MRAVLGFVKGALIGGAIGYGAVRLGFAGGSWAALACAVIGAVVGIIAGKAPWRADTVWTPIVKLLVGGVVGAGLCLAGQHLLPDASFTLPQLGRIGSHSAAVLGPLIGAIYGVFVEVDDSGDPGASTQAKAPSRKR